MIVTVTPSPSIDWTVRVPSFDLGAVNRATESLREASGKGVNVSWALHRAQVATHAIFPAGGDTARFMNEHLSRAKMPHTLVPNDAEVRTNISLVIDGQSGTKINEPGAPITAAAEIALLDSVSEHAESARFVLSCGSLPFGASADLHARVVTRATAAGTLAIVDASGAALKAALPEAPALIKPNAHELAELTGTSLDTLGDVIDAARAAIAMGPASVLVSLGGDGALLVTDRDALHARASGIPVVNTVGAGDALLAGFVSSTGDVASQLATAVLWASSAVAWPTTLFPVRDDFAEHITVRDAADGNQLLTEPGRAELA